MTPMIVATRYVPHRVLAEHTGDSGQTLYNHRQAGRLQGFKRGVEWYSDIDVVNEWLAEWRPDAPPIRSIAKERLRDLHERCEELQSIVEATAEMPHSAARNDIVTRLEQLLESLQKEAEDLRVQLSDEDFQLDMATAEVA